MQNSGWLVGRLAAGGLAAGRRWPSTARAVHYCDFFRRVHEKNSTQFRGIMHFLLIMLLTACANFRRIISIVIQKIRTVGIPSVVLVYYY